MQGEDFRDTSRDRRDLIIYRTDPRSMELHDEMEGPSLSYSRTEPLISDNNAMEQGEGVKKVHFPLGGLPLYGFI